MGSAGFPFGGTAMIPGVSLNRRLYTADVIGKAVRRAQERIDAGEEPLTMLTHHDAEDKSTEIVGRITRIWQEPDGRARYSAVLASTDPAENIRDLIAPRNGAPPFLKGVSIRGWWLGDVRTERGPDGDTVTVADDLELDGLDFTRSPGVVGAGVDVVGDGAAESVGRVLIYESASVDQSTAPKRSPYADLGYRGVRRYPLHTPEAALRSWLRVADPVESAGYSPAQIKRIRSRIKATLKEFGVAMPQKTRTTFGKVEEFYGEEAGAAGLSVCAYNGPLTINVSAYGIDADQLQTVADAAMDAAMSALAALDGAAPEADDAEDEPSDDDAPAPDDEAVDADQMETAARPAPVAEQTRPRTPAAATTRREPTVASTTPAAPTAAPTITLTQEQFGQLMAAARGDAPTTETAPAEPVIEETDDERIARLVRAGVAEGIESFKDELRSELRAVGPRRLGLVKPTTESQAEPEIPLHQMSQEQRDAYASRVLNGTFGFDSDS